jgi:adenine-specific DNA glycosylase
MHKPFPFSELHDWYLQNGRATLPWRDYSFDKKTIWYRVWLAETMLQQTQVERVKSYFENILLAFPRVEDLAACSYEDFFPYYKWLWYYSRARNMLKAAQTVVDDFDWIFPDQTLDLRTLAWVGPYTAEAIRAFAYNKATLSFDTNLEKIFSRYYHGNKFQKLTKDEKAQILEDFQKYYSHKTSLLNPLPSGGKGAGDSSSPWGEELRWGIARDMNNALMDYGATISLNNISWIDWDSYPLPCSKFYQTKWELEPVKEKKKSTFPNKQAYVIAVLHENHKVYFSSPCSSRLASHSGEGDWGGGFSPFFIWKNTGDPRALVQSYFLAKHGLELSVRPPEVKSYNSRELPYMVCYCQIQSGKHEFVAHKWIKVRGFEEWYVEEMEFGESSIF